MLRAELLNERELNEITAASAAFLHLSIDDGAGGVVAEAGPAQRGDVLHPVLGTIFCSPRPQPPALRQSPGRGEVRLAGTLFLIGRGDRMLRHIRGNAPSGKSRTDRSP